MKNIVIAGTSGVGKSFLEEELQKRGLSFAIPKYTDRPLRPGEDPKKLISISATDFEGNRESFFFTLKYGGFNYGWHKKDLEKAPVSLAITQESLEEFLQKNADFLPVLLVVNEDNFEMLKTRMKTRGDNEEKIKKRLEMAREENKVRVKYEEVVKKYVGLVFEIKDDSTIFESVIPELAKRQ